MTLPSRTTNSGDAHAPDIAAVTMVFNSPAILAKWISHYGSILGQENLFVISHGDDKPHKEIAKYCNHITLPRRFDSDFDFDKAAILSDFCATLLSTYNAVICGDVDELIVVDPAIDQDLVGYIDALPQNSIVAPVGINVMPRSSYYERPYPRVDLGQPLLSQCNRMSLAPNFCKPSIFKARGRFAPGQHWLAQGEFTLDPALALFHLKYLALNDDDYYRSLAEEISEFAEKTGKPIRHKLWVQGQGGLSQTVGQLDDNEGERASTPRKEAEQLRIAPVSESNPKLRVVGPRRGELFQLEDAWLTLL